MEQTKPSLSILQIVSFQIGEHPRTDLKDVIEIGHGILSG